MVDISGMAHDWVRVKIRHKYQPQERLGRGTRVVEYEVTLTPKESDTCEAWVDTMVKIVHMSDDAFVKKYSNLRRGRRVMERV